MQSGAVLRLTNYCLHIHPRIGNLRFNLDRDFMTTFTGWHTRARQYDDGSDSRLCLKDYLVMNNIYDTRGRVFNSSAEAQSTFENVGARADWCVLTFVSTRKP